MAGSVSVIELVPEVRKSRRGFALLSRRGTASVVRTCVPVTLVSQLALKASRMDMAPSRISPSKPAPALLIRTSRWPCVDEMDATAASREASEERST
jgi:hypothetical protein